MSRTPPIRQLTSPGLRIRISPGWQTRLFPEPGVDRDRFRALLARSRRVAGGRGENALLELADGEPTLRIRPARHGGLLARFTGDRFHSPRRIEDELDRWIAIRRAGAPVPEPAFAASLGRGLCWRSMIATVEQSQALDLRGWLAEGPDQAARLRAARAIGEALRRFHDAGAIHGDLHLGNVLIDRAATRCWLVDLDRTHRCTPVTPADRLRDLMRLVRSSEKRGASARLAPRERAAALSAYCQGDRAMRRAMRQQTAREMRQIRRHRLGWRLGRLLRSRSVDRVIALGLPFLLALPIASCEQAPDARVPPSPPSGARLSLLAVGDTGRTRPMAALFEGALSVSDAMTEEAVRDPVDGLVLLGDNFYWNGLSSETLVPRVAANLVRPFCHFLRLDGPRSDEVSDSCRRPEASRAPVPIYAVLGNHDIEIEESPRLQREVIPEFLPDWQMSPGLARAIELGHGVSLILFESEPEIDDRQAIRRALVHAIQSARGPWRILATHRPVATDDLARPFVGGYPEFVLSSIEASGRPVQLVLAAHHHNLQVFELAGATPLLHVGVGSGARAEPPIAEDHPDARLGRLELGFVRVDLIGRGADERLSATLFEAPRWPLLAPLRPASPIARFEVDRAGRVNRADEIDPVTPTDRP